MLTTSRIRIAFALVLSLTIHAGIMNLNSGRLQSDKKKATITRRVTMTLTGRQPKTVEPSVELVEEIAPVIEKKAIQKTENVVVREIPRPLAVPVEQLPVVERKTRSEKIAPEPSETSAVQQQEPVADVPVAGRSMVEEKAALLPVIMARPLYKKNPRPVYPTIARRRRYQGTTLLEVLVDSQGRVGELRVFQSCGYEVLDRAALTAVKGWLFEPGRLGDDKIDMWVRVPVRFQLR